jgi:hypothetical protein
VPAVPEINPVDRELHVLTGELRLLEQAYTLYFAGQTPRPPVEHRLRFEQALRRCERNPPEPQLQRFRFATLQARYASLADLWDRGVRAREEGRPGPFARSVPPAAAAEARPPVEHPVHTATFTDPASEFDALHDLYDALMDARRNAGQDALPFHRFASFIKQQVASLQQQPHGPVAFMVRVRDGKVSLSARPIREE